MNETTQAGQNEVAQDSAADERKETELSIDRQYFAPDQLEQGQTVVNNILQLAESNGLQTTFNFNPEEGLPEGYGLATIPISKRQADRGNITIGVVIAAIPSPSKVATEEGGNEFIHETIVSKLVTTIANAARPRGDSNTGAASLPFSVNDFITSQRGESLGAWRKLSSDYVKALKQKAVVFRKLLTASLLRSVLESSDYAKQVFPTVSQDSWVTVLDSMMKRAATEGLDASGLQHWKETRDTVEVATGEVDLSDLDDMNL